MKCFMRIRGRAAIATWLDVLLIIAVASLPLIIYIIIIDGGELQDVLEMLMGFSIILLVTTPILAVALITVIISPLFTEMYATLKDGVLKVNGEIIDPNAVKQIDYSLFEDIRWGYKNSVYFGEIYVRIWIKNGDGDSKHIAIPHASYGFYRTLVRLCPEADHKILTNGGIKKWIKIRLITYGMIIALGAVIILMSLLGNK